jgi:succinate dehydrogenase / fumarate reductase flavoprotein subunit
MLDLLIIGSGSSALSAALFAKESGLDVAIYSKTKGVESGSCMAQGGINSTMPYGTNTLQSHIEDTLRSSCEMANPSMIEYMCKNAQECIEWLQNKGVAFSKEDDGKLSQRKLGGASEVRACYAQDYSGLKIIQALNDSCIKEDLPMHHDMFLLSLYPQDGYQSATFLDINTTEVIQVDAASIILATGGYASIYKGYSTNRDDLVGSGAIAALRAGIRLSDLEFVQFHPTTLLQSSILISESARGAGGIIYNQNKERFVDELLTRDKISREIYKQIEQGNQVYLDITHIDHEFLEENLPQEIKLARTYEGINPLLEPIPIKPSAHYSMGGIEVDKDMQTSQKGIFAIGECANAKVHGANRLGGNSLLELITLAKKAITYIAKNHQKSSQSPKDIRLEDKEYIRSIYKMPCKINFYEKRAMLGEMMYKNCGIFKDANSLKTTLTQIRQMQNELRFMGIGDKSKSYNTNLIEFLEFANTLELCEAITINALNRKESRGAHFREDFPQSSDEYKKTQIIWKDDGAIHSGFVKVGP